MSCHEHLESWLHASGLSHTIGYLHALGARTVQDLHFLTEEDLKPLPPVTVRRIVASHWSVKEEGVGRRGGA